MISNERTCLPADFAVDAVVSIVITVNVTFTVITTETAERVAE